MEGAESRCRMESIGQKVQNGRCRLEVRDGGGDKGREGGVGRF